MRVQQGRARTRTTGATLIWEIPGYPAPGTSRRGGTADARNCPRFRLDRTGPRGRAAAGPDRRGDPRRGHPGPAAAGEGLGRLRRPARLLLVSPPGGAFVRARPGPPTWLRSRRRQPGRTDRTDALRSLLRTRLLQEGRGSGWGGDPGRLCPLDARPRRPRGGRGDRGRRGLHPGPRAGAGALADFVEPATLGVEPVHDHVRRASGASRPSPPRPRRSGSTSGPRRSAPGWRRPSRTTTRGGSSGSGD